MEGSSPDFDSIKQINVYGTDYWSARDLMPLLGYANKWQNFKEAIARGMTACEEAGNVVGDHFTDATKMIAISKSGN